MLKLRTRDFFLLLFLLLTVFKVFMLVSFIQFSLEDNVANIMID